MKRFLAWVLLSGIFPTPLFALGLGKLDLRSGLNEPFEATIELLSPTRDELDNLNVRLADSEAFARAGIQRPFVLSQLRFAVEEGEGGPDRIRVYSREAMREPFLNFLVEASWSQGRLYREYTVLLDPPLYDSGGFAAPEPIMPAAPLPVAEGEAVESPEAEGVAAPAPGAYAGGDYGPTVANDTLWSIASRTRPDATTTVQQMMLALVRTNPDAFIDNNVNGLKRGQILRMPGPEEMSSLAAEEAFNQVKAQYAAWQQAGGAVAAATPQRPVSTAVAEAPQPGTPSVAAPVPAEGKSELKLVTPSQKGAGADQGASQASAATINGKAGENLALANEQVETLTQENLELKNRLTESQTIVEDLKRLIALKDDELAAMQQKLAMGAARPPAQPVETEPVATTPAETKQAEPAKTETKPEPPAAVAPVKAPAETAAAPPEAEPAPAEAPAAEAEQPAPPARKPAPVPVDASQGLFTQVSGLVKGNIQNVAIVAGGIAAVLVVVFLVSRRRRRAEEAGEVALEFPDFSGSEAETVMPGAEEEGIEVQKAAPEAPQAPARAARAEAAAPPTAKPAAAKPAAAEKPAAPPVEETPAAPQEDPLGPVNVFMAYEHFDQAEEFVRDAIGREPGNLDFHVKLLEVLSVANERKKYEEAAKVLHDKVNGTGAYWETALFYWDAMSPGRALFAAPAAGEEEAPAAAAAGGGGMLDLTAGEAEKPESADIGLDFDLGEATAAPAPAAAPAEEEILDITAGSEGMSLEPSIAPAAPEEDVLDVTAAVGLDAVEASAKRSAGEEEGVLDLSQSGGEDLLDVTAHADLESTELSEDLLDVTTATGAGADADELLAASAEPAAAAGEGSVDFDLNLGGAEAPTQEKPGRPDNVIEFEGSGSKEHGESLDMDITASGAPAEEEEGGLELDLSMDSGDTGASDELSLESAVGEGGLELDTGGDTAGPLEIGLEESGETDQGAGGLEIASGSTDAGLGLDLSLEEPEKEAADIDMEGTVEVPKIGLSLEGEEDEEEEDHTVFVPRTKDATEQTAEDEIATKLDLAKAYVELGDKDSAKTILNEVISAGSPQQRKQAQDLMKQMS